MNEHDDAEYYSVGKKVDWLLDHIPYGWRIYYKYRDARVWTISTYQKIRYGCSDKECWNLDVTLSKIIHTKLCYFKKMNRMGWPSRISSDCGISNTYEDLCIQKWEEILDEMIWTFDFINNPDKYAPFPEELMQKNTNSENLSEDLNREKTQQKQQIWNQYVKKCEDLGVRKQKGLELFAKHFDSLWD